LKKSQGLVRNDTVLILNRPGFLLEKDIPEKGDWKQRTSDVHEKKFGGTKLCAKNTLKAVWGEGAEFRRSTVGV